MAAPKAAPVSDAQTFMAAWGSASKPICVTCADGVHRVLKGRLKQPGTRHRSLFNDQVIGRLGNKLGGPVPAVSLVNLSQQFIDTNPRAQHIFAGICHATEFRDKYSDRVSIFHTTVKENRPRYAALAIMYGWAHANDHQSIYPNDPPPIVLSVDTGTSSEAVDPTGRPRS